MNSQFILCTLIGILPSVMLIVLLIIIRKSGRILLRVKSSEAIPYAVLGLICFVGGIYILVFKGEDGYGFYAVSTFLIGVYIISHSLISKKTIRQNGIIILNPLPSLLKWVDIDSFGVNGRKIYFKKKGKGSASIIGFNEDMEDIVKVISKNVAHET